MLNDFNDALKNNDLKFTYNSFVIKTNLLIKKCCKIFKGLLINK